MKKKYSNHPNEMGKKIMKRKNSKNFEPYPLSPRTITFSKVLFFVDTSIGLKLLSKTKQQRKQNML